VNAKIRIYLFAAIKVFFQIDWSYFFVKINCLIYQVILFLIHLQETIVYHDVTNNLT